VIRPALAKDQVVICDRFADSTRIYQGYVGGLLSQTIDQLEAVATDGLMPEVTFVLDVSADVAMSRRKARLSSKGDADDRFEKEDQSFHDKVAKGFRWLCDTYPQRCLLIDGSGKPNAVAVTIRDSLRLRGLI
jgi:dTMP kinase